MNWTLCVSLLVFYQPSEPPSSSCFYPSHHRLFPGCFAFWSRQPAAASRESEEWGFPHAPLYPTRLSSTAQRNDRSQLWQETHGETGGPWGRWRGRSSNRPVTYTDELEHVNLTHLTPTSGIKELNNHRRSCWVTHHHVGNDFLGLLVSNQRHVNVRKTLILQSCLYDLLLFLYVNANNKDHQTASGSECVHVSGNVVAAALFLVNILCFYQTAPGVCES